MPGRFAPTPSGRMHIGNIYAMLGAWLSARSSNDAIYLRIEDIDEPRVVPGAADLIMDDLQWLGLDWDGAPVYQSARHHLYEDALRALQRLTIDDSGAVTADATGNATPLIYPCFCSRADIRAASAPQDLPRHLPQARRDESGRGTRTACAGQAAFPTHRHARFEFDDCV